MSVTGYLSTWHDIAGALNIHNLFFLSYDKTTTADGSFKSMNKNSLWIYLKINTKICLLYACVVFKISQNKNNVCGRVTGWNLFLLCVVWPLIYLHYSFLLFGHFFYCFPHLLHSSGAVLETSHFILFHFTFHWSYTDV